MLLLLASQWGSVIAREVRIVWAVVLKVMGLNRALCRLTPIACVALVSCRWIAISLPIGHCI
jgi:hypothetical protein